MSTQQTMIMRGQRYVRDRHADLDHEVTLRPPVVGRARTVGDHIHTFHRCGQALARFKIALDEAGPLWWTTAQHLHLGPIL